MRLRSKIVSDLASLEETTSATRTVIIESADVIPNYLQSEIDAAKDTTDIDNAVSVFDHCTARKQALKNALIRMDRGEFGICQSCGIEIGTARLQVAPGTNNCIHCQEEMEMRFPRAKSPSLITGSIRELGVA